MTYKCQGCKRVIKYRTWKKYEGYSRQCLAKEILPPGLKKLLSLEILPDIENELYQNIYTKNQYNYIYGIKNKNEYYFNRYITNQVNTIASEI